MNKLQYFHHSSGIMFLVHYSGIFSCTKLSSSWVKSSESYATQLRCPNQPCKEVTRPVHNGSRLSPMGLSWFDFRKGIRVQTSTWLSWTKSKLSWPSWLKLGHVLKPWKRKPTLYIGLLFITLFMLLTLWLISFKTTNITARTSCWQTFP